MNQVSAFREKAPYVHRDVPGNLLDPVFSGMPLHAGDMNLPTADDNKKQDIISPLFQ